MHGILDVQLNGVKLQERENGNISYIVQFNLYV